jgi:hypothetical protein
VHENACSALDCGGSTPPFPFLLIQTGSGFNLDIRRRRYSLQGGVEPPQSKVPSAQPIS